MSAPVQKNLGLALRTTTTRTAASPAACSAAERSSPTIAES
jgi:hypothetical protein